jgi:tRNA (adenine22-N1)-methyltransferase
LSIKDSLLSLRLQAIYDCIDQGSSVADIGTDHAYLPIALASEHKCAPIYAVDNKQGPLKQAQKMVEFYGVQDRVICTLVGVDKPYHHVDTWIIAGMGFQSVKRILTEYDQTVKRLNKIIIQVNHQVSLLRTFCIEKQFHIIDEILVYDDFYYTILVIQYKNHPSDYTSKEIEHGPILLAKREPIFIEYCQYKKAQLSTLLQKIPSDDPKWQHINHQLETIDEILNQ